MDVSFLDLSPLLLPGFASRARVSQATQERVMARRRACVNPARALAQTGIGEGVQWPVPSVPSGTLWSLVIIGKFMEPHPQGREDTSLLSFQAMDAPWGLGLPLQCEQCSKDSMSLLSRSDCTSGREVGMNGGWGG